MAAPANGVAAGGPEALAAALLDFGQPLQVELLDSCVASFYTSASNQEVRALPLPGRPGALWTAPAGPGGGQAAPDRAAARPSWRQRRRRLAAGGGGAPRNVPWDRGLCTNPQRCRCCSAPAAQGRAWSACCLLPLLTPMRACVAPLPPAQPQRMAAEAVLKKFQVRPCLRFASVCAPAVPGHQFAVQ